MKRHTSIPSHAVDWLTVLGSAGLAAAFLWAGLRCASIAGTLLILIAISLTAGLNGAQFLVRRLGTSSPEMEANEHLTASLPAELIEPGGHRGNLLPIFGFLYLTNKRLLFMSRRRSIEIKLMQVRDIQHCRALLGAASTVTLHIRDRAFCFAVRSPKSLREAIEEAIKGATEEDRPNFQRSP